MNLRFLLALLVLSACTATKQSRLTPDATTDNLKKHIAYLADDKLEGRRTGTPGEKLAKDYILGEFSLLGLEPMISGSFSQPFQVYDGRQPDDKNYLIINNISLSWGTEYFTFPASPKATIDALPAVALQEYGMPWFVDLKELLEENKQNPHFDLNDALVKEVKKAGGKVHPPLFFTTVRPLTTN